MVGLVYAPLPALEVMLGDRSNTRVYLSLLCGCWTASETIFGTPG